MKSILSIDPGLTGTGWAAWEPPFRRPSAIGVIKIRNKDEWWIRCQQVADEIATMCDRQSWVVAEFTEYHAAVTSSMGWKTGDLQRLTFLCGVIAGRVYPTRFTPVTASGWKGQLPKDVAAARVQKLIGRKACRRLGLPEIQRRSDTHAWDAVGIGLWALGRFK